MVQIRYIDADATEYAVDVQPGSTVMEGARLHGIEGIVAECGGNLACGTCQVYVDESWWDKTGSASELEEATLEIRDDDTPNKRLSCQLRVTEALDGLVVRLPVSQF